MGLKLEAVTRKQGAETHIAGVTLELEPGSFNVLLGRTLAGKTSMLRLMAGLDAPSAGRVIERGRDVTGLSVRQRDVAMVYQQFINYPAFTVFENIASPLRRQGLDRAEIDRRVNATAGRLRLDGLLDRLPAELSGGQQQRTAIARALAKGAGLLLLDEPLVNLDYKLREELREELRGLFTGGDTIVVYATTEPTEALILGGNTAVMHEGTLAQFGPTLEVWSRPATVAVGAAFSDPPMNFVDAVLAGDGIRLADGTHLPLTTPGAAAGTSHDRGPAPGPCRIGFRANHLSLTRRHERMVPIRARVELSEINGSLTYLHLVHGEVPLVALEEGVHSHRIGDEVTVHLDPARVLVFSTEGKLIAAAQPGQRRLAGVA